MLHRAVADGAGLRTRSRFCEIPKKPRIRWENRGALRVRTGQKTPDRTRNGWQYGWQWAAKRNIHGRVLPSPRWPAVRRQPATIRRDRDEGVHHRPDRTRNGSGSTAGSGQPSGTSTAGSPSFAALAGGRRDQRRRGRGHHPRPDFRRQLPELPVAGARGAVRGCRRARQPGVQVGPEPSRHRRRGGRLARQRLLHRQHQRHRWGQPHLRGPISTPRSGRHRDGPTSLARSR